LQSGLASQAASQAATVATPAGSDRKGQSSPTAASPFPSSTHEAEPFGGCGGVGGASKKLSWRSKASSELPGAGAAGA
jgi:hypothetical protein